MPIFALCKTDLLTQFQPTITPTTHKTTTTASSSLGATATVTALITAPTQSVPGPTGLSTATKAGIGVAAAVSAILLVVLGAYLNSFIRRRRRHRGTVKPSDPVEIGPGKYGRASIKELGDTALRPEGQIPAQELDGPTPIAHRVSQKELDGTHWKRELEGDTPKRANV
ncbi:hypothetical protein MMC30_005093 [Trapelia coarctata]|nr:hypothetical protein [Trapelia coarctata]